MLSDALQSVRQRIQQACARSGRDPSAVTLVAVTKGIAPDVIQQAIALGVRDVGENRIQEARSKRETMRVWNAELGMRSFTDSEFQIPNSELPSDFSSVKWHLIGHVQRNKAKPAVELFDVIHSVDSPALLEALERQAAIKAGGGTGQGARGTKGPLEVLIQVNISREKTKFGCHPEEVLALAQDVTKREHLRLKGLMTIAPFSNNPEDARPIFRELRTLRDTVQLRMESLPRSPFPVPLLLSMGMSQDFEAAIEEGADIVRIGTAIFGSREKL